MRKNITFFKYLLLPIDILMIILSFALAYYIRSKADFVYIWPFPDYLKFLLMFIPVWVAVFSLEGLYNLDNPKKGYFEFYSIIIAASTSVAIMVIELFLSRTIFFSRLVIVYGWGLSIMLITIGRWLTKYLQTQLYKKNIGVQNLVVVGSNKASIDLVKLLKNDPSYGYNIVGVISTNKNPISDVKILGDIEELENIYKKVDFDNLILADTSLSEAKINQIFDFCDSKRINFKEIPNLFDIKTSNAIYTDFGGIPIINFRRTPLEGWGSIFKRIFDIIGSSFFILLTSPIMLLTAIAIKLDSPGPVFFVYNRIGRYGKPFTYFKFRSMVPNAHQLRYTEEFRKQVQDLRGWNSDNPMIKYKNDPRITKVGKFIRKYSIDELPEFFLVFLGRMSLVGPRPHEKEEVEKYKKHHKKVLTIKPGITGMAQVSGRSDLTFDDEVRLDTYYIENWSLWLDIKTVFKTPLALLSKRKAL